MSQYITPSELEHLNEAELRAKFNQILADLHRAQRTLDECPLIRASLENIQTALHRRRQQGPKI